MASSESHIDARRRGTRTSNRCLSGYHCIFPRNFDEMMDHHGRVREHWRPFLSMLAALGPDEVNRRFAAADRHLRDSGVFYRVYEDPAGAVRPWPLSHVPLLIDPTEWQALKAGLIQRAELLEAILADIYGPANLVREGASAGGRRRRQSGISCARWSASSRPAARICGSTASMSAARRTGDGGCSATAPRRRRARAMRWRTGSRCRARCPTSIGSFGSSASRRSSRRCRRDLSALSRRDDSPVCVLTPGPLNETYFEHAYLARYLGFLLVEGEDLTVRDDGVFIRTVSGLKRAEVLLRRLDSDFADPLELSARSRLGVPGLVQAVRDGTVVMANALGSGVVEARAMLSFLPALAPAVLGRELMLPNVATWWLGDPAVREAVMQNLDDLVIAPAFSGDLPPHIDQQVVIGKNLDADARARVVESIGRRGVDFVAQEAVTLSTTPVWENGQLVPRPFSLRLLLARDGDGWQVMPGGFVRIADELDARAINLQQGGRTGDAWILSDKPVAQTTLLPTPDRIKINRTTGALPSRAASNLFWLGRYVERTEATLRLVRALVNRSTESTQTERDVNADIVGLLSAWEAVPEDMLNVRPAPVAAAVLQQRNLTGALPFLVGAAQSAASVIRDRFSPDAWRALTELVEMIRAPFDQGPSESAMVERVNGALRILASFSGLAQENMSQLAGWRFLEIGRRIERTLATSAFIRQFAFGAKPDGGLDVLLELADSQITYRLRYVMVAAPAPVIDLVALDPNNPRSIVYQLARIETHLAAMPKRDDSRLTPPEQIAIALVTKLRTSDIAAIDEQALLGAEAALMKLSDVVASTYFTTRERSEAPWEAHG